MPSPEHALVATLTLLSERSPVAKDPRMNFGRTEEEPMNLTPSK